MILDQSENNKRIAKNTLLLYFRMFFTMAVTLYTSRVILKALGVEDFGIYNVVAGIVTLFSFFSGALSSAASRFISFELGSNNTSYLSKVFSAIFIIHLLFSVVVVCFAETIGLWVVNCKLTIPPERIFAAHVVYQFSVFSCIVGIMQIPLNAMIIAHERLGIYAYMSICEVIGKLSIAFVVTYCSFDHLIVYGMLLFSLVVILFVIYFIYCRKKFPEYRFSFVSEKEIVKNILGYFSFSLWGAAAYVLKDQGVSVVLNIFFGPVVNASRAISYQVNSAINSFAQNLTLAMSPQIIKSYACNDIHRVLQLLFRGTKFSYFLILFLSIPVILETKYVLSLWLGQVPEYTLIFVRLVIVNTLIDSFTYIIGATVQATGRIKKYQLCVGGILLLNLPLSYFFLRLGFSPYITFLIAILIAILCLVVRVLLLNSLLRFSIREFVEKILGLSLLVTFMSYVLPFIIYISFAEGFMRFLLVVVAGIIGALISIWFVGFGYTEREFVKKMIFVKSNI